SITANQVADTQEEQPQKETPQEEQPEQPQEETPQEEQPQEQQPQQPQEQQPQAPATTTYKTLDVVNVRDRASKEGALIGVYGEGALLNKTGEDGEWTIIDFNGTPGYVKTEFLEPVVQ
ncbi:MAG: SH3 domain-containing protein, partial [Agathobacter sp.]|nr:SH3 domain-containing protein [Agathobacter sp.]